MPPTSLTCPGPHQGPELPPPAPALGPVTALCSGCGTVSQVCPRADCCGRTRAGGFVCRSCGHRLPPGWRAHSWDKVGPGAQLASPAVARTVKVSSSGVDPQRVQLLASDAWVGLAVDQQLLFLEPGPKLEIASELTLGSQESAIEISPLPEQKTWELLTSKRRLAFEPRTHSWEKLEALSGVPLWRSRDLWAFELAGGRTELRVGPPSTSFFTAPSLLSLPAWPQPDLFVCHGGDRIYFGAPGKPPGQLAAPEPLASSPPAFEPQSGRLFLPGGRNLWSWKPGGGQVSPVRKSGGGAVTVAGGRVVIVEGDRLTMIDPAGRTVWDSQVSLPSLARAALTWDQAGSLLLLPLASRGNSTELLLVDPRHPGLLRRQEIEGTLVSEPRLVPGGITAVRQGTKPGTLDLIWIGLQPEDKPS